MDGRNNGKSNPMKSTIDQAGRLVIPRELRRAAGLEPGMALDLRIEDGAVIIEPAPLPVTMKRRGRFVVAHASVPVPPLAARTSEETREQLRSERGAAGDPEKE
jgi:AbrB family looped-hinge helix DNA binding protein